MALALVLVRFHELACVSGTFLNSDHSHLCVVDLKG